MKPRIPITSPAFKYTSACETDISVRFRRIRREQKAAEDAAAQAAAEREQKVRVITKAKG